MRKTKINRQQIAEICNVAPDTVRKWFFSGNLKGHKELQGRTYTWVTNIENLYDFLQNENRKKATIELATRKTCEKIYTTKDLCMIFGVSREMIRIWRNKGLLVSCSAPGKKPVCYTESAVEDFAYSRAKYWYLYQSRNMEVGYYAKDSN